MKLISLYYKIGFVIFAEIGNGDLNNILFKSNSQSQRKSQRNI